jgi:hypothetical protein
LSTYVQSVFEDTDAPQRSFWQRQHLDPSRCEPRVIVPGRHSSGSSGRPGHSGGKRGPEFGLRPADFVRQIFDEVTPLLDDVVSVWRGCKSPVCRLRIGMISEEAQSVLLSRATEHRDNAPISVPLLGSYR